MNKQRVLVFSARGITQRDRHLMVDLRDMMPHSKTESKFERKDPLFVINEVCVLKNINFYEMLNNVLYFKVCEMKNCNKCIFFEGRKKQDLFMWLANIPKGPSAKFYVENGIIFTSLFSFSNYKNCNFILVHTMKELKMTGNCLKGTRPLLSFDSSFDTKPYWSLLKELMTQVIKQSSYSFLQHIIVKIFLDSKHRYFPLRKIIPKVNPSLTMFSLSLSSKIEFGSVISRSWRRTASLLKSVRIN